MKKTLLALALVLATGLLFAQKKTTTSAVISFDATTSLDKLPKAENKTVVASLDTKTGKLAFEAVIKNFAFSNPRIQDHFNNKGWMDSDTYPTASFKGAISNADKVKFTKDGEYAVTVTGELTMHGVTKTVETTGTIVVAGKSVKTMANFDIKLADYNIDGPAVGAGKVSREPTISVTAEF